jgi:hypothetical protein
MAIELDIDERPEHRENLVCPPSLRYHYHSRVHNLIYAKTLFTVP